MSSFIALFAVRLLMGIAEGSVLPVSQALTVVEVAPARRGLAMGFMQNFGSNSVRFDRGLADLSCRSPSSTDGAKLSTWPRFPTLCAPQLIAWAECANRRANRAWARRGPDERLTIRRTRSVTATSCCAC